MSNVCHITEKWQRNVHQRNFTRTFRISWLWLQSVRFFGTRATFSPSQPDSKFWIKWRCIFLTSWFSKLNQTYYRVLKNPKWNDKTYTRFQRHSHIKIDQAQGLCNLSILYLELLSFLFLWLNIIIVSFAFLWHPKGNYTLYACFHVSFATFHMPS